MGGPPGDYSVQCAETTHACARTHTPLLETLQLGEAGHPVLSQEALVSSSVTSYRSGTSASISQQPPKAAAGLLVLDLCL